MGNIERLSRAEEGRDQFSITIKNYGEIPSSSVIVKYAMKSEIPTRRW